MEAVFNILNEDNVRTLVIIVAIACGVIWLNSQLDKKMNAKFNERDEKLDKKFDDFYVKLKTNDFAPLNAAIEALAYVLKKSNFIDSYDNKFIESKLAKC